MIARHRFRADTLAGVLRLQENGRPLVRVREPLHRLLGPSAWIIAALALVTIVVIVTVERPTAVGGSPTTILATGDIAECDRDEQEATAALLDRVPGPILGLGDYAYDDGTVAEYAECFDPSWGRHKARIRPTRGNHEGDGYLPYFADAAAPSGRTYYAFSVGAWQVISLDSELCLEDGDCDGQSEQEQWLREELERDDRPCTLAYFHHPRFSSGRHGSDDTFDGFWKALYEGNADVVLVGHDHHYERFAPMRPDGTRDDARGLRQFIVGTGGANLRSAEDVVAGSEVRQWRSYGFLQMQLLPDSYTWRFLVAAGDQFEDAGVGECH
jgi:acid phosphatase type 7